jgi:predicted SAM-dependent methyltransferase
MFIDNNGEKVVSRYVYTPAKKSNDFDYCVSLIRDPKTTGGINNAETAVIGEIFDGFASRGYPIKKMNVDVDGYRDYVVRAGYRTKYPSYYTDNFHEKSLEHYLAAFSLKLAKGDLYVDIASEHSPIPDIYKALYEVTSYRQDIMYEEGIHGDRIGCDACHMPLPDNSMDKLTLTCSLEHFEGDSDSMLIKEIDRILKPGGAAFIVPFYLFNRHAIQTDPLVSAMNNVTFDKDAIVYCCKGWNNRHGRFYDHRAFAERIVPFLGSLAPSVYFVENAGEVHDSCYCRFALKLTKI